MQDSPEPVPSSSRESRRQFLKSASAAAAGAVFVPRGLSWGEGAARVPRGANEQIGVGVIGVGGMGSAHGNALAKLHKDGKENLRLVAFSDVCKPRLDSNVEKHTESQGSEVGGHRDYRDLLERKDVDAVWIASPEHWHAQMAIDAMSAGKDVYLEKPMCLNLADAMRLYHAAKKSKQVLAVGTQYVMEPKYHKAAELIREGVIGKPVSSVTGYCRNSKKGEWLYGVDPLVKPGEMLDWEAWCGPLGPAPFDTLIYHRWRRYRKYSTGIVGDLLVHVMTPLVHALDVGWPVRVVASGGHYIDKAMENHDQVNLIIEFEKEHTMVVWGSTCNSNGPSYLIRGHKANLELGGNNCNLVPENAYSEEIDPQNHKLGGSIREDLGEHDALRVDFLECCRERREPASPVELGLKIMVIVDLATRSMWDGHAYTFDPKSMEAAAV